MSDTATKLTYLNTTKTLIKEELNLGGANITTEPFRQYKSKLHSIYKDFLANGTDTLWNNWEKVSGTGTQLSLTPTIKGKMKVDLKGNTYQYTTTGKNKLDLTGLTTQTANGITITPVYENNNLKHIAITGTPTGTSWTGLKSVILPAGTYTLSGINVSDTNKAGLKFLLNNSGSQIVCSADNKAPTFTINQTTTYDFTIWVQNTQYFPTTPVYLTPQVEVGNQSSSYEPYTNGASPSPNWEQPIQVVSGDNTIKVEGKNLFDKDNVITGKYISGTGTIENNNDTFYSDYIKVSPNTNYCSSGKTGWTVTAFYDSSKNFISRINDSTYFTTTNNTYYIRTVGLISELNVIQIEYGTSSSSYVPYVSQSYPIDLQSKNLIEPKLPTQTRNGITLTNNGDGSWVLNGTATSNADFRLDQSTPVGSDNLKDYNGTYTLSCNELHNGIGLTVMQQDTWEVIARMVHGNTPITFTTNKNNCFIFIYVYSGTTFNNYKIYPQLEKGNQATSWKPYFTPIELCKIGTYQDKIAKSTGKNLFDGVFRQGNQHNNWNTSRIFSNKNDWKVNVGDKFTFSTNLDLTTFDYSFYIMQYPYLSVSSNTMLYTSNYQTTNTFTINCEYEGYFGFTIRKKNESNLTPSDVSNYWFQIEKGNTATTYEPYIEKGKWYLNKQIGKVVLDGSSDERWFTLDNNNRFATDSNRFPGISNVLINTKDSTQNITPSYCNHFVYSYQNDCLPTNNKFAFSQWANVKYIYVGAFEQSVSDLETWLSTNNLIVYYPLATPTYEEITDTTLLGQLNALENANSYNNTTNVSQSNDDLPFILDITALKEMS